MWPKRPVSVVIDSATYLLTISSPDIDNVAMSLYDITFTNIDWIDTFHICKETFFYLCAKLKPVIERQDRNYVGGNLCEAPGSSNIDVPG